MLSSSLEGSLLDKLSMLLDVLSMCFRYYALSDFSLSQNCTPISPACFVPFGTLFYHFCWSSRISFISLCVNFSFKFLILKANLLKIQNLSKLAIQATWLIISLWSFLDKKTLVLFEFRFVWITIDCRHRCKYFQSLNFRAKPLKEIVSLSNL